MRNNSNNSNNSGNEANKKLFEDSIKLPVNPIQESQEKKKKKKEEELKTNDVQEEIMSTSSDFKRIGFIGQGSSGLVEKALYIPKNLIVALKVLSHNFFYISQHSKNYIEHSFKLR